MEPVRSLTPTQKRRAVLSLSACVENLHTSLETFESARALLAQAREQGDVHRIRIAQWDVDCAIEARMRAKSDLAEIALLLLRSAAEVLPLALSAAIGQVESVADLAEQVRELQRAIAAGGGQ